MARLFYDSLGTLAMEIQDGRRLAAIVLNLPGTKIEGTLPIHGFPGMSDPLERLCDPLRAGEPLQMRVDL